MFANIKKIKAIARTRRSTRVFSGSVLSSAAFGAEHSVATKDEMDKLRKAAA